MKRFVDGVEVELSDQAEISQVGDRLLVRTPEGAFSAVAVRHGDKVLVSFKGRQFTVARTQPRIRAAGAAGSGELRAPMPGAIVDVMVAEGEEVRKGQKLLVLEAMKTQQPFLAPFDGTVSKLNAAKGQQVLADALLALISEKSEG